MKRNEAWEDLLTQAEQIPDELETRLNRTIARAERREKRRRWLKPLIGVTGTAAAFVLLVNSSVTFALAASRVPIVRELVEAVAFDPSLKAAVAHDYVQLVGDTYTQDGVTVTVEYLIADPMNVSVFYSLSDEQGRDLELIPHLQDTAGNALPVSMTFGEEGMEKNEGEKGLFDTLRTYLGLDKVQKTLYTWRLHASKEGVIQTQMQLHVEVRTQEIWQDADMYEMDERESQDTPAVLFTLDIPITIEPQFLQSGKIFPVGQTADVLGQKLTIDEIEVYPSNTRITWHTDPENDAWLTYLPFYLTDEDGNRVDGIRNGVSGTGNDRDYGGGAIWLDSAWYDTAEHLTVHLDDAAIVPKDQDTVLLQADGQLTGLPDYIEQVEPDPYWEEAAHTFRIRTQKGTYVTNTCPFQEFIDADGQRDSFSSISTLVMSEDGGKDDLINIYPMPQGVRYPLTLFIDFAPGQKLENPIEVHT